MLIITGRSAESKISSLRRTLRTVTRTAFPDSEPLHVESLTSHRNVLGKVIGNIISSMASSSDSYAVVAPDVDSFDFPFSV